jgi:hypothetical protein
VAEQRPGVSDVLTLPQGAAAGAAPPDVVLLLDAVVPTGDPARSADRVERCGGREVHRG